MKTIDKEDLYKIFYEQYCIKGPEDEQKIIRLREFIEELYDEDKKIVVPLTERETFILRKKYGCFSGGIRTPQNILEKELGISHTLMANILRRITGAIPRRFYSNQQQDLEYTVFDFFVNEIQLSRKSIGELGIDGYPFYRARSKNVLTIGDLLKCSSKNLHLIFGNSELSNKVINKIHEFGIRFLDELSDEEKKAIFNQNDNCEKLENTDIAWLNLSYLTEKQLKNIGLYRIKDLGKINFEFDEVSERLRMLGIKIPNEKFKDISNPSSVDEKRTNDILNVSITDIGLSTKVLNSLKKAGINTTFDLVGLTVKELATIRGLGQLGCTELIDVVHKNGLEFKKIESKEDTIKRLEVKTKKKKTEIDKMFEQSFEGFNFGSRVTTALKRDGILNLKELVAIRTTDLEIIPNIGEKSVREIINKVHNQGLKFADEVDYSKSDDTNITVIQEENTLLKEAISRIDNLVTSARNLSRQKEGLCEEDKNLSLKIGEIIRGLNECINIDYKPQEETKPQKIIKKVSQ